MTFKILPFQPKPFCRSKAVNGHNVFASVTELFIPSGRHLEETILLPELYSPGLVQTWGGGRMGPQHSSQVS